MCTSTNPVTQRSEAGAGGRDASRWFQPFGGPVDGSGEEVLLSLLGRDVLSPLICRPERSPSGEMLSVVRAASVALISGARQGGCRYIPLAFNASRKPVSSVGTSRQRRGVSKAADTAPALVVGVGDVVTVCSVCCHSNSHRMVNKRILGHLNALGSSSPEGVIHGGGLCKSVSQLVGAPVDVGHIF